MYGSAMNSPDNDYQISEGWFSGATSLYDPDNAFVSELINPGHNLFGFIDARYNFQVRTKNSCLPQCGFPGTLSPDCLLRCSCTHI